MNDFHSYSMRTQYNQEDDHIRNNKAPTFNDSRSHSAKDIYNQKLEQTIKEMTKNIKNNKPIIEQLECQRRFFKRVCEKQKEKIKQIDVELIREEYSQQLMTLRQKREKMHDFLGKMHQDAQSKQRMHDELIQNLRQSQQFLQNSLRQLEAQNNQYSQILRKKQQNLDLQKIRLNENSIVLAEKQKIRQKYELIKKQIEWRESSKK